MVLPAQQRVTTVAHAHPHWCSLSTVPPPASGITMTILGYLHLRPHFLRSINEAFMSAHRIKKLALWHRSLPPSFSHHNQDIMASSRVLLKQPTCGEIPQICLALDPTYSSPFHILPQGLALFGWSQPWSSSFPWTMDEWLFNNIDNLVCSGSISAIGSVLCFINWPCMISWKQKWSLHLHPFFASMPVNVLLSCSHCQVAVSYYYQNWATHMQKWFASFSVLLGGRNGTTTCKKCTPEVSSPPPNHEVMHTNGQLEILLKT